MALRQLPAVVARPLAAFLPVCPLFARQSSRGPSFLPVRALAVRAVCPEGKGEVLNATGVCEIDTHPTCGQRRTPPIPLILMPMFTDMRKVSAIGL